MDSQEKLRKIEAAKRKLEKHKKKQVISASNSSNVINDSLELINPHQLVYDSHMASSETPSEVSSSENSASQLNEKVIELEEILIGKQSVIDSLIEENETLKAKLVADSSDVNNIDLTVQDKEVLSSVKEYNLKLTELENGIQAKDNTIKKLMENVQGLTRSRDDLQMEYTTQIDQLTTHVHTLQSQLKQAGQWLHNQIGESSALALMEAKDEILALQRDSSQKESQLKALQEAIKQRDAAMQTLVIQINENNLNYTNIHNEIQILKVQLDEKTEQLAKYASTENESSDFLGMSSDVYDQFKESLRGFSSSNKVQGISNEEFISTMENSLSALRVELDEFYGIEINKIKDCLNSQHQSELRRLKAEVIRLDEERSRFSNQATKWQEQYVLLSQQNISTSDLVQDVGNVLTENIRLNQLVDELRAQIYACSSKNVSSSSSGSSQVSQTLDVIAFEKGLQELDRLKSENSEMEKIFFNKDQLIQELEDQISTLQEELKSSCDKEREVTKQMMQAEFIQVLQKNKDEIEKLQGEKAKLLSEISSWQRQYILLSQQNVSSTDLVEQISSVVTENIRLNQLIDELNSKSILKTREILVTSDSIKKSPSNGYEMDDLKKEIEELKRVKHENEILEKTFFTREQFDDELENKLDCLKNEFMEMSKHEFNQALLGVTDECNLQVSKLKEDLQNSNLQREKLDKELNSWRDQYIKLSQQSLSNSELLEEINNLKNENLNLIRVQEDLKEKSFTLDKIRDTSAVMVTKSCQCDSTKEYENEFRSLMFTKEQLEEEVEKQLSMQKSNLDELYAKDICNIKEEITLDFTRDIEKLKKDLKFMSEERSKYFEEAKTWQNQYFTLSNQSLLHNDLEEQLNLLTNENHNLKSTINDLNSQVKMLMSDSEQKLLKYNHEVSVANKEIDESKSEIYSLNLALSAESELKLNYDNKIKSYQNEIEILRNKHSEEIKHIITDLELEINMLKTQLHDAKVKGEQLVLRQADEITNLESSLQSQYNTEIEKLKNDLTHSITELQLQKDECDQLRSKHQTDVDSFNNMITQLNSASKNATTEKENIEQNLNEIIESLNDKILTLEMNLTDKNLSNVEEQNKIKFMYDEKIVAIYEESNNLIQGLKEKLVNFDQMQSKLTELSEQLEKVTKERDSTMESLQNVYCEKVELKLNYDKLNSEKERHNKKVTKFSDKNKFLAMAKAALSRSTNVNITTEQSSHNMSASPIISDIEESQPTNFITDQEYKELLEEKHALQSELVDCIPESIVINMGSRIILPKEKKSVVQKSNEDIDENSLSFINELKTKHAHELLQVKKKQIALMEKLQAFMESQIKMGGVSNVAENIPKLDLKSKSNDMSKDTLDNMFKEGDGKGDDHIYNLDNTEPKKIISQLAYQQELNPVGLNNIYMDDYAENVLIPDPTSATNSLKLVKNVEQSFMDEEHSPKKVVSHTRLLEIQQLRSQLSNANEKIQAMEHEKEVVINEFDLKLISLTDEYKKSKISLNNEIENLNIEVNDLIEKLKQNNLNWEKIVAEKDEINNDKLSEITSITESHAQVLNDIVSKHEEKETGLNHALFTSKMQLSTLESKIESIDKEKIILEQEYVNEMEELTKEHDSRMRSLKEMFGRESREMSSKLNEYEEKVLSLTDELEFIQQDNLKLSEKLSKMKAEVVDSTQTNHGISSEETWLMRLNCLEETKFTIEKCLDNAKADIDLLNVENKKLSSELEEIKKLKVESISVEVETDICYDASEDVAHRMKCLREEKALLASMVERLTNEKDQLLVVMLSRNQNLELDLSNMELEEEELENEELRSDDPRVKLLETEKELLANMLEKVSTENERLLSYLKLKEQLEMEVDDADELKGENLFVELKNENFQLASDRQSPAFSDHMEAIQTLETEKRSLELTIESQNLLLNEKQQTIEFLTNQLESLNEPPTIISSEESTIEPTLDYLKNIIKDLETKTKLLVLKLAEKEQIIEEIVISKTSEHQQHHNLENIINTCDNKLRSEHTDSSSPQIERSVVTTISQKPKVVVITEKSELHPSDKFKDVTNNVSDFELQRLADFNNDSEDKVVPDFSLENYQSKELKADSQSKLLTIKKAKLLKSKRLQEKNEEKESLSKQVVDLIESKRSLENANQNFVKEIETLKSLLSEKLLQQSKPQAMMSSEVQTIEDKQCGDYEKQVHNLQGEIMSLKLELENKFYDVEKCDKLSELSTCEKIQHDVSVETDDVSNKFEELEILLNTCREDCIVLKGQEACLISENKILQDLNTELNLKLQDKNSELDTASNELQCITRRCEDLDKEILTVNERELKKDKDLSDLNENIAVLNIDNNLKIEEINVLQDKLAILANENSQIEKDRLQKSARESSFEKELNALVENANVLNEELKAKRDFEERIKHENEEIKLKCCFLENKLSESERLSLKMKDHYHTKEDEKSILESQLKEEINTLNSKLESAEICLNKISNEKLSLEKLIGELTEEEKIYQNRLSDLTKVVSEFDQDKVVMENKINELEINLEVERSNYSNTLECLLIAEQETSQLRTKLSEERHKHQVLKNEYDSYLASSEDKSKQLLEQLDISKLQLSEVVNDCQKLKQKFEECQLNLNDKNEFIKRLENDGKVLKVQMEDFLSIQKELIIVKETLKNEKNAKNIFEEEYACKISLLNNEVEGLRIDLGTKTNNCLELESINDELQKDLQVKCEAIIKAEVNNVGMKMQLMEMKSVQEELISLRDNLEHEKNSKVEIEKYHEVDMKELKAEIDHLRAELDLKNDKFKSLQLDLEAVQKLLEEKCVALSCSEEDNQSLKTRINNLESVRMELSSSREALEHERLVKSRLETELESQVLNVRQCMELELKEKSDECLNLKLIVKDLTDALNEKSDVMKEIEANNASLKSQMNDFENIHYELITLREVFQSEKNEKADLEARRANEVSKLKEEMEIFKNNLESEIKSKDDECFKLQEIIQNMQKNLDQRCMQSEEDSKAIICKSSEIESIKTKLLSVTKSFEEEKNGNIELTKSHAMELSSLRNEIENLKSCQNEYLKKLGVLTNELEETKQALNLEIFMSEENCRRYNSNIEILIKEHDLAFNNLNKNIEIIVASHESRNKQLELENCQIIEEKLKLNAELENTIEDLRSQNAKQTLEIDNNRKSLEDINMKYIETQQKNKLIEDDLETKCNEVLEKEITIQELKKKCSDLEHELSMMTDKNFAISEECQQIRLKFEDSLITVTAQQNEIINLKNENCLLNTKFEELEHALSDRERAVGSLQENLKKATSDLHALQNKSDNDKLNYIEITNSLKDNVSLFMEQLKASETNAKYFEEQFQLLNSEKISVCEKLGITSDDEAGNLLEKIDSLKHSIDDFSENERDYKNLITSLGINNDELKNAIRTLEMQFSTKCLEVKDMENLFEQQLTSIAACNREEILNMIKEIESRSSESDHLKCCLIDIENKLKSIENDSNVVEDKLEKREAEIFEKQCALDKLQVLVQELNGHLNEERNTIIEKESKFITLQDEILVLKSKLMLQDGEFSLKQSELMNTINNLSNQLNNANLSHSEQQMNKDHPDLLSSNLLMSENNSELENKTCIHEKNLLHIDGVSGSFVENHVESIIKRKPTCYVFNYSTTNNEDDKSSVCSSKTTKLEHAKLLKTKKLQEKEITKLKEKCVELENVCKNLQSDYASAAEEINRINNEKYNLIYQISSLEKQLKYDRPEKPNVSQIDQSIECCILNINEPKKLCTTNSYCQTLQEAHYQNTHLEEKNDGKEFVELKIENQSQGDGAIQADATTSETFKHFQEFEIEEATLVSNMEGIYLADDCKMVCNKSDQDAQLDTSDLYNENPKEFRNAFVETESKSQAVSSISQTDFTLSDFNDAKSNKDAATETTESLLDIYANPRMVQIDNSIFYVMKEAAEFYGNDTRTSVQVKSHEDVKADIFQLSSEYISPSIEVASTADDIKNRVDVAVEKIINQHDIDNMEAEIKELNAIIDDLKNKITVLDEEKLNFEKNYGQMNERHLKLDSQNESLKNQLIRLTDDYKDKEDSYKKDLNKLTSDLHQATSEKVSTCDRGVATSEITSKNESVENSNAERSQLIDILHSVFDIPLELDDSAIESHLIKFKNNLQNRDNVRYDEDGKEHKSSNDEQEETSLDRREIETALETLESLTFTDTNEEVTRIVNNLKPQIKVLCRSDIQNSKKCDELVHQRDLLKEENIILTYECEKLRSDLEQLKQESERAFNALKLSCFDHVNQFDGWSAAATSEVGGGLLSASFLASGLKSPSSFSGSETFLMSDDGRLSRSEIDEFQTKVSNLERENNELKMNRDDSGSSDGHLRLSSFQSETSTRSLQESPDDVDKAILDQTSPIGRKSFSPSTSLNVERFLIRTPRSITSTSNDYQLETREAKGKTTEDYMYLQNEFKKFKQKVRTEYTKLKNRLVETLKDYNYLKLKYQEVCDANRFHSLCDNNLLFSENNALRIQILDLENTISCLEQENKTIGTSNADDPNKSIEDVKQLNEKLVQQELQISILQSDCNCLSERNALLEKQLLETERISSFELQTDLSLLQTMPFKGDMKEASNATQVGNYELAIVENTNLPSNVERLNKNEIHTEMLTEAETLKKCTQKSQKSVSKLPVRAVPDQKKSKAIHAKDFSQSIKLSESKVSVKSCPSKDSVSSQEAAQSKPLKVVSSVRQDPEECKRCQNLEKECKELKKSLSRSSREELQELRSTDPDEDDDNAGVKPSKLLKLNQEKKLAKDLQSHGSYKMRKTSLGSIPVIPTRVNRHEKCIPPSSSTKHPNSKKATNISPIKPLTTSINLPSHTLKSLEFEPAEMKAKHEKERTLMAAELHKIKSEFHKERSLRLSLQRELLGNIKKHSGTTSCLPNIEGISMSKDMSYSDNILKSNYMTLSEDSNIDPTARESSSFETSDRYTTDQLIDIKSIDEICQLYDEKQLEYEINHLKEIILSLKRENQKLKLDATSLKTQLALFQATESESLFEDVCTSSTDEVSNEMSESFKMINFEHINISDDKLGMTANDMVSFKMDQKDIEQWDEEQSMFDILLGSESQLDDHKQSFGNYQQFLKDNEKMKEDYKALEMSYKSITEEKHYLTENLAMYKQKEDAWTQKLDQLLSDLHLCQTETMENIADKTNLHNKIKMLEDVQEDLLSQIENIKKKVINDNIADDFKVLEIENDDLKLQCEKFKNKLEIYFNQKGKIVEENGRLQTSNAELENQKTSLFQEMDELNCYSKSLSTSLYEKFEENIALQNQYSNILSQNHVLKAELSVLKNASSLLEKESNEIINNFKVSNSELEKKLLSACQVSDAANIIIGDFKDKVLQIEKKFEDKILKLESSNMENKLLNESLDHLKFHNSQMANKNELLIKENKEFLDKIEQINCELVSYIKEKELLEIKSNKELELMSKSRNELDDKLKVILQEKDLTSQILCEVKERNMSLESSIIQLNIRLKDKDSSLTDLNSQLNDLASLNSNLEESLKISENQIIKLKELQNEMENIFEINKIAWDNDKMNLEKSISDIEAANIDLNKLVSRLELDNDCMKQDINKLNIGFNIQIDELKVEKGLLLDKNTKLENKILQLESEAIIKDENESIMSDEINECIRTLSQTKTDYISEIQEITKLHSEEVKILKQERDDSFTNCSLLREELLKLQFEKNRLLSTIADLQISLKESHIVLENLKCRAKEEEGIKRQLNSQIDDLTDVMKKIEFENVGAVGLIEELKKKLCSSEDSANGLDLKLKNIISEKEVLQEKLFSKDSKIHLMNETLSNTREELNEKIKDLEAKLEFIRINTSDLKSKYENALLYNSNLESEKCVVDELYQKLKIQEDELKIVANVSNQENEVIYNLVKEFAVENDISENFEVKDLKFFIEHVFHKLSDKMKHQTNLLEAENQHVVECEHKIEELLTKIKVVKLINKSIEEEMCTLRKELQNTNEFIDLQEIKLKEHLNLMDSYNKQINVLKSGIKVLEGKNTTLNESLNISKNELDKCKEEKYKAMMEITNMRYEIHKFNDSIKDLLHKVEQDHIDEMIVDESNEENFNNIFKNIECGYLAMHNEKAGLRDKIKNLEREIDDLKSCLKENEMKIKAEAEKEILSLKNEEEKYKSDIKFYAEELEYYKSKTTIMSETQSKQETELNALMLENENMFQELREMNSKFENNNKQQEQEMIDLQNIIETVSHAKENLETEMQIERLEFTEKLDKARSDSLKKSNVDDEKFSKLTSKISSMEKEMIQLKDTSRIHQEEKELLQLRLMHLTRECQVQEKHVNNLEEQLRVQKSHLMESVKEHEETIKLLMELKIGQQTSREEHKGDIVRLEEEILRIGSSISHVASCETMTISEEDLDKKINELESQRCSTCYSFEAIKIRNEQLIIEASDLKTTLSELRMENSNLFQENKILKESVGKQMEPLCRSYSRLSLQRHSPDLRSFAWKSRESLAKADSGSMGSLISLDPRFSFDIPAEVVNLQEKLVSSEKVIQQLNQENNFLREQLFSKQQEVTNNLESLIVKSKKKKGLLKMSASDVNSSLLSEITGQQFKILQEEKDELIRQVRDLKSKCLAAEQHAARVETLSEMLRKEKDVYRTLSLEKERLEVDLVREHLNVERTLREFQQFREMISKKERIENQLLNFEYRNNATAEGTISRIDAEPYKSHILQEEQKHLTVQIRRKLFLRDVAIQSGRSHIESKKTAYIHKQVTIAKTRDKSVVLECGCVAELGTMRLKTGCRYHHLVEKMRRELKLQEMQNK